MQADPSAVRYGPWAERTAAAIRGERDAEVPCGTCTACCTSAQFVHISPDESDALAHIPAELRFPAPMLPEGHQLMGYDDRGCCPMFRDGACSIYEHRPRTCRTYDCRVFPATGVSPDPRRPEIARAASRWHFEVLDEEDRRRRHAVHVALGALRRRIDDSGGPGPEPTQLAARAVEVHERHLGPPAGDPGAAAGPRQPT